MVWLVDSVLYVFEFNNTYSDSTVCNTGYKGADYSVRSFIICMDDLGNLDIILVFEGTNDSWVGYPSTILNMPNGQRTIYTISALFFVI